ncbi:hypothetical protein SAY86_028614 [Trapa natans]|uniref:SART-1 family protein DOT2 n=1 Tax=Trapa natans TaxID=22666 RepID=A0AAN7LV91_TRANT|nr:hypothetical protein SAY86_028614 [Trapa natans]
MDGERLDSKTERSRGMENGGDFEENGDERSKESSRHRSRRDEKDYRSKERERDVKDEKVSSRDRRKDERDERDKDRRKDYRDERDKQRDKERERDRDRKDRARETEKENDHRAREKERVKEDRSKEKGGREKERDKVKEKEREKHREGEKERDRDRIRNREEGVDRHDREKDDGLKLDSEQDATAGGRNEQTSETISDGARVSTSELEERITKAKEERERKKSEGVSEVLGWISRSRKLEDKRNARKDKVAQLARVFEEQDNIEEDDGEDEVEAHQTSHHLAGVKILHGLDKVIEGGTVVLTLKDQSILADGDVNDEVDMLENVEIGEQKRRDDAYKASKKKMGVYDDKFNDDPTSEKKMLPQYDDPVTDEGVTLDARGRFTVEAEKKLAELRRRLEGTPTSSHFEDLTSTSRKSLDYYTQEEMLQFKKPKKKKSIRKKEKLDLDALEAEAISSGLGAGDLGSRNDVRGQAVREEQEKSEAERRNNAYQLAYAKAEEASKLLRLEQTLPVKRGDEESAIFDEDEDFYKSLERARKLTLKKQKEEVSGPKAVALLATSTASNQTSGGQNQPSAEEQENKVVITEMEEFVWGLQLDEESRKPDGEDVFMDEDAAPVASDNEQMDVTGRQTVPGTDMTMNDDIPLDEDKEEIAPDETIHEAAVGKGLSGALKLLKDRGTLKETVEWGGRNMDKKKSKLVGIAGEEGPKEIRIERRDEFGRVLTPKEAFRMLSHKFHGKGPGKKKQEKRIKQYQEELKLKQMKNADTPSLSAERMREAQAQMSTPYLVLSGHVKPGQSSDPRSAFATIEKGTGSLTPMLGDRKVEHFLGIKRKPDSENMGPPKKPKT